MTKSDPWHNTYPCPECEADVSVALPFAKYATCDECKTKLEIHPDADFEEGHWHDRTALSVVEPEEEHVKRMVEHAADVAECEHKYREEVAAPLGVRCLHCGHFVGAWE